MPVTPKEVRESLLPECEISAMLDKIDSLLLSGRDSFKISEISDSQSHYINKHIAAKISEVYGPLGWSIVVNWAADDRFSRFILSPEEKLNERNRRSL